MLILQIEGRKRWRIWRSDAPPPLDPLPALTFETSKRIRSDYRGTPFGGRGAPDREIEAKTEWNLDVRGLPVEQLPATVARPNFGVLMRRNLTTGVSRPVAVLLGTEATKVKQ